MVMPFRTAMFFPMFVSDFRLAPNSVIKLMGAHLVLAFAGFLLILLFLDKINTKMDSTKPIKEVSTIILIT
jgi:hypothetical protein